MLQDAEAGRPIELDALVTAVHEIGARVGVATPNIDALLGLTRLMARSAASTRAPFGVRRRAPAHRAARRAAPPS